MNRPDADTLFSFSIDQITISPEDLQAKSRIQDSKGIDLSPGGSIPRQEYEKDIRKKSLRESLNNAEVIWKSQVRKYLASSCTLPKLKISG
jgi:hypothetical protein